jgi:hypothetical protein
MHDGGRLRTPVGADVMCSYESSSSYQQKLSPSEHHSPQSVPPIRTLTYARLLLVFQTGLATITCTNAAGLRDCDQ